MIHLHFKTVTSTNDFAKEMLKEHDQVLISADFQMLGRGRNNKVWEGNPAENIYCSLGIKHRQPQRVKNVSIYQGLGCLAVKETLERIAPDCRFYIKYPNDVYAVKNGESKKICGVLVENGFMGELALYTIIGIGINVLQSEYYSNLKDKAVSLKMLGIDVKPHDLLNALKSTISKYLDYNSELIFDLWKKELNIVGKEVNLVIDNSKWLIDSIDVNACLIAKNILNNQKRLITNGDSIEYQLG